MSDVAARSTVIHMVKSTGPGPSHGDAEPVRNVFADLRRHNEYAARVAHLLEAKRKRHIQQVLQLQRKQRLHQAR